MKILLTALAIFISISSFGQGKTPTFSKPNYKPEPNAMAGQMLNIANAYTGTTVTDTIIGSSGTVYLYIATGGTPVVAVDTFVPYPIFGYGSISFTLNATKVSGTPDLTATLEQSPDGIVWGPATISYQSVISSTTTGSVTTTYTTSTPETFTMANTSGVQSKTWSYPIKYTDMYRMKIAPATTTTQVTKVKAGYYFSQAVQIQY